ncbi:MAG: tetratricopeptide repeat protein [Bacteroidetes bacterium]|nr:MAG: tetratricopeptide repeat protein [Bacteroidota bacterium]
MNSFGCTFHFDDFSNIVNNPAVCDLANWRSWLFFNPRRPVGFFSFALNYHWNGLDVWGYHLVNLVFHIGNALLVWNLLILLFRTPQLAGNPVTAWSNSISFFTALLFVAHPVMTEAVTYIVQRLVLLSSFFYLLSLVLFLQGAMTIKTTRKYLLYTGAVLSAILSFFSKEPAYTLPFMWVLIWVFFLRERQENKKGAGIAWIMLIIPVALVALLSLLALFSGTYFGEIPPREGHPYSITIMEYYLTQLQVLITYIRLILLPVNQTFDYDYPISQSLSEPWTLVSFLLLLLLLAGSFFLYKKNRLISFGILWFFLTILPQSVVPRPNVIFEHRVYLSVMGIMLVWVILVFNLAGKIRILIKPGMPGRTSVSSFLNLAFCLLLMQVFLFTWFTWRRNSVWKSELSLWTDCLEKAPCSARSWVNRGCALLERQEYHEAVFHFDQALQIFPHYLQARNNRGVSIMALKDYPGAIADFTQVIRLNNNFLEAWANRGIARRRAGQYASSIEDFTQAIALDTNRSDLYFQRGITFWLSSMEDSATKDIVRSMRMGNRDAERFFSTNIQKY